MKNSQSIKEKALFLLDAINNEDFKNARECLHPDFTYKDPLTQTTGRENFISTMEKRNLKYILKKKFIKDQEVCLMYHLIDHNEKEITAFGIHKFQDDKVKSLEVVFDPRALLDAFKTN